MGTVYVSSTFKDLVEERKLVRKAIGDLDHQAVGMETYGAGEETVIEKCSNDIERSSGYILIVAWRYGWRPHGTKSITQIEWERARAAGLSPLVYLKEDDTAPPAAEDGEDLKLVHEFRDLLQRPEFQITGRFRTGGDLERRVLIDVPKLLGPPVPLPPPLRSACDRQDFVAAVSEAWRAADEKKGPIVALAYGKREQGAKLLAHRLAGTELPKLRKVANQLAAPVLLDWSQTADPRRFVDRMHAALWSTLQGGEKAATSAQVAARKRLSFVVSVEVPSDPWTAVTAAQLEAYATSWRSPPYDAIPGPIVVLLHARSDAAAVQETFRGIAGRLGALGRFLHPDDSHLHDVQERHVLTWIESEPFRRFCGGRDPTELVHGVFRERPEWEMEPVVRKVESIACKFAESRGVER